MSGTFLRAEWRWLAMVNFEVDPALLARHVPPGTELDAWNGKTFVSVVGFLFLGTRVLGVPIPFHRDFEEVNLRFYVRRGDRRGVVFVKEIVPRFAIAAVARLVYGENYVSLPMRHRCELDAVGALRAGACVEYSWRPARGKPWSRVSVRVAGEPRECPSGSEEEFITEHYWGYAARRGVGATEYQVEHPRWRIWSASAAVLDADVASLYGSDFVEPLRVKPSSAFLAEGSPVVVRRGVAI